MKVARYPQVENISTPATEAQLIQHGWSQAERARRALAQRVASLLAICFRDIEFSECPGGAPARASGTIDASGTPGLSLEIVRSLNNY